MKNLKFLLVLFLVGSFYSSNAQNVTKTDTLNGTPLVISLDSRINADLENLEKKCNNSGRKNSSTPAKKKYTTDRALTTEEICRNHPEILGFKIQVNIAKSNAEANKLKADFRSKFPYLKVQTDASLLPNYRVLAGSYFKREDAAADLRKIKQYYGSARTVQYKIYCAEARR